jgi:predicted nucleic acid-binding protein
VKRNGSPVFVLDSFALISILENEPGAQRVLEILREAEAGRAAVLLCIINYGEALYITEREQGLKAVQEAVQAIDHLPVLVVEADRKLTLAAAHIKAKRSVSYADAFAIALAMDKGGRVVTGDPEFRQAESLVEVEWIPR